MKKYTIFSLLLSLLLMIGCGKDLINYSDGLIESDNTECGYLVIPSSVSVSLVSETFIELKSSDSESVEAGDDYIVTIENTKGDSLVYDGTYGEFKELELLALSPSTYSIMIQSVDEDDVPMIGTDPYYVGQQGFTIVTGLETTIDNLTCEMESIKVSLTFTADMLDLFQEDSSESPEENLNVIVSIGDVGVDYGRLESGSEYYFKAVESNNTLELELTGMYNIAAADEDPNYTMIEGWKETIVDVKSGQWRNITLGILYASAGTVDFEVKIETWSYDDEINVDITSSAYLLTGVSEPELDDPENYISDANSPTLTLGTSGGSINQIFYIDVNSFGIDASIQPVCTDPLIVNVATENETSISEMWVEFSSDNASLNTLLESALGSKRRQYILPTTETSSYYTIDGNEFTATYQAMYQLYIYNGTHTATIMVEDSEGRRSYNELTIVASSDVEIPTVSAPTIEWVGDYDFDERYSADGLSIVLNIEAEGGITGFTVVIDSEVLTPEVLAEVNLVSEMDLINPGDIEEGLVILGFPVGDEVEGQTELTLDISSFMPMLLTQGAGDSNFTMNVTNAGGTTSKTIKVKVE